MVLYGRFIGFYFYIFYLDVERSGDVFNDFFLFLIDMSFLKYIDCI